MYDSLDDSEYNDFIGLDVPTIEAYFEAFGWRFEYSFSQMQVNIGFTKVPPEILEAITSVVALINSMFTIIGICGAFFGIMGAQLIIVQPFIDGGLSFLATFAGWLITTGIAVYGLITGAAEAGTMKETYIGMGIGFLVSGISAILSRYWGSKQAGWKQITTISDFKKTLDSYNKIFGKVKKGWKGRNLIANVEETDKMV